MFILQNSLAKLRMALRTKTCLSTHCKTALDIVHAVYTLGSSVNQEGNQVLLCTLLHTPYVTLQERRSMHDNAILQCLVAFIVAVGLEIVRLS